MALPDLYTTSEVIEALKLSRQTVRGLVESGQLKAVKVGQQYRFHAADVEALLNAGTVPVTPRLLTRRSA